MKIRNSFVTNSSSSSYIVARKKNATKKDLLEAMRKKYMENKNDYIETLKRIIEGYDISETDYEEDEGYYGEGKLIRAYFQKNNLDEEFIDFLMARVEELFSSDYFGRDAGEGILDSWELAIVTATNEDDDFFQWLMYNWSHIIENDLVKVF